MVDPPEGAEALVRRASMTSATRPVALGAATALVIWTPAKEEVAAIMVVCVGMKLQMDVRTSKESPPKEKKVLSLVESSGKNLHLHEM